MTIGIKTASNDIYVFTAVTAFAENYDSRVTEHPVEGRTNITDHVINSQPSYKVSGVIVPSDISGSSLEAILFLDEKITSVSSFHGATEVSSDSVVIKSSKENSASKLVPEAFSNLIEGSSTTVEIGTVDALVLLEMKRILIQLKDTASIVSLILFDGDVVSEIIDDCLISSLSFEEGVDTGDMLDINMSLTKASFVTLGVTTAPKLTWKEIDLSSKDSGNKGAQQGNPQGGSTPSGKTKPPAAVKGFADCQAEFGRESPINCLLGKGTTAITDIIIGDGG